MRGNFWIWRTGPTGSLRYFWNFKNSDFWKLLRPPLIQFSKFNNFPWGCWFLGNNISNFVPPFENSTTHIAILKILKDISGNRWLNHQLTQCRLLKIFNIKIVTFANLLCSTRDHKPISLIPAGYLRSMGHLAL